MSIITAFGDFELELKNLKKVYFIKQYLKEDSFIDAQSNIITN